MRGWKARYCIPAVCSKACWENIFSCCGMEDVTNIKHLQAISLSEREIQTHEQVAYLQQQKLQSISLYNVKEIS